MTSTAAVSLAPVARAPITNARSYFLARMLIHAGIKFPALAGLARLWAKRHPDLSVRDVEHIFYICGIEREAENILMIRALVEALDLQVCYDVGSNFGQFASALASSFQAGLCVDANPAAVAYLDRTPPLDHFQRLNRAVVPAEETADRVILKIPRGNTGKALIGELEGDFDTVEAQAVTVAGLDAQLPGDARRFVKFDIEGLEPQLVRDYLVLDRPEDVIAFEVLTTEARDELDQVFQASGRAFRFVTLRYSFLAPSGFMGHNKAGLLAMFLTGRASVDSYVTRRIADLPFGFMSLIFAIPEPLDPAAALETLSRPVRF